VHNCSEKNTVICCINCVALSFHRHFYSCIFHPLPFLSVSCRYFHSRIFHSCIFSLPPLWPKMSSIFATYSALSEPACVFCTYHWSLCLSRRLDCCKCNIFLFCRMQETAQRKADSPRRGDRHSRGRHSGSAGVEGCCHRTWQTRVRALSGRIQEVPMEHRKWLIQFTRSRMLTC